MLPSHHRVHSRLRRKVMRGFAVLLPLLFLLSSGADFASAAAVTPGRVPGVTGLWHSIVNLVDDLAGRGSTAHAPSQVSGTAADAKGVDTRSGRGAGAVPGKGKGQLGAYHAQGASSKSGASGTIVKGFNAKTSKRVASKSNAYMDYFQNQDGSFTRKVSKTPINYQNSAGAWTSIDPSLERNSSGGYTNTSDAFGLTFSGGSGTRAQDAATSAATDAASPSASPGSTPTSAPSSHPTTGASASSSPSTGATGKTTGPTGPTGKTTGPTGNGALATINLSSAQSFGWSLAGAADVTPSVSGATATYGDILPDTTLSLTSENYGVSEYLWLDSAAAGNSWTFPLSMTGVSLDKTSDGAYEIVDSAGAAVATLSTPWAYDGATDPKSGLPESSSELSYSLSTVHGVEELTMTLDKSWLDASSRTFPVQVDPDVTVGAAGQAVSGTITQDCTVGCDADTQSTNYMLQVGYDSDPGIALSYIDFPSADVADTGYHVSAAQFAGFLFHAYNTASTYESYNVDAELQPYSASTSYTYADAPQLSSPIGAWAGDEDAQTTCDIDGSTTDGNWTYAPLQTADFNLWSANQADYYGIGLSGTSTTDDNYWKLFASTRESGCSPYLYLTYTADVAPQVTAMSPSSGSTVNALNPTLTATGTDSDDWPLGYVEYYFEVLNAATGSEVAESSSFSTTQTFTVPSGDLAWNQTYEWLVVVYDGFDQTQSSVDTFTTAAPPPALTDNLSQNSDGNGYDASIGNYTTSAVDANLASAGPSLQIERDYNSLDPRTSQALGAGWSSLLDSKVTQVIDPSSGKVLEAIVTYPDGSQVPFGLDSNGDYVSPEGRYSNLTFVAAATGYTLVDKDDTTYNFEHVDTTAASGTAGVYQLSSVCDALKRCEDFSYSASTGGYATKLQNMVSNRYLTFGWTTPTGASFEHVASVEESGTATSGSTTNITWTYDYSGDQLAKACNPDGACTAYSYEAMSQYANAMLDTSPNSYWRLGDAAGATAAADSVLQNENADPGTYSSSSMAGAGSSGLTGSAADAATLTSSSSQYVTLPNSLLLGHTYVTLTMRFKTTGDGPLLCEQNGALSATPTNATCSLYVGTDGKLHGAFFQGATTPISSTAVVNDGKWHTVVLSADGTTQTLYLDGAAVGTLSGTVNNEAMSDEYIGGGYNSTDWADTPTTKANWFFSGSISDVAYYTRALSASEVSSLYTAESNATALLTQSTEPSGAVDEEVGYNLVTGRVTTVTNSTGGTYTLGTPTVTGSSEVFRAAVLGAGPRAYYRLNDAAGATTATDQVKTFTGAYNAVALGQTGKFADSTVAKFNGSSSYVDGGGSALNTTGNFSVSAWAELNSLSGAQDIVTQDANYNSAFFLQLEGGQWAFSRIASDASGGSGGIRAVDTTAPTTDTWYFLTGTYVASTGVMTLYVNGQQVATATDTTAFAGSGHLEIGRGYYAGKDADWYGGEIGDVAAYQSTLSATEAEELYTAGVNSSGIAPVETVKITDPDGNTLKYEYDPENSYRLIAATDARGFTTTYGYDSSGFLNTVTDPNGDVTTTGHDVRGNEVSETTCQNQATNACTSEYWTYYPDDTSTTLTPSPENDEVLTDRGEGSSSATDNTYESTYSYNSTTGNLVSSTDELGRTTTLAYTDGTSVLAYGSTTTYAPAGLPYKTTDANGDVTTYEYYADGDLAETISPLGETTLVTYDGLGRAVTKTESYTTSLAGTTANESEKTTYTYNGEGQILTETDPAVQDQITGDTHQAETTNVYNTDGLPVSQTVSDVVGGDSPRTVGYTYNGYDEVIQETDGDGGVTTYGYDAFGDQISETDPDGITTQYTYDPDQNLGQTIVENYTGSPSGSAAAQNLVTEARSYDNADRLATITDAMGFETEYTYTDNGLLSTETRVSNVAGNTGSYVDESNIYDAAGDLSSQVTRNGALTTNYTYDAAGRVTKEVDDPTGVDRTTTYTYNTNNQVTNTQTSNTNATDDDVNYTYDDAGDQLSQEVIDGATDYTTSYAYDQRGLQTSETDPDGNTSYYAYDAAGQLYETVAPPATDTTYSTATGSATVATEHPTTREGYNTFGDVAEELDSNGDETQYYYDADGQKTAEIDAPYTPADSSTPINEETAYTYDGDGNLTEVTDDGTGLNETYSYDQLGDKTSDTDFDGNTTSSAYDTDGDLLSTTDPTGAVTEETYDFANRPITQTTVDRYTGSNNDTTSDYTTDLAYDQYGNLANETSPAGVNTSFGYNDEGEQTSATDGAGNTTQYGYDAEGRVVRTQNPDGTYDTVDYDQAGNEVGTAAYGSTGTQLQSTSATYDGDGDELTSTDPNGDTTDYTYDATGMLTSETQPVTSTSNIQIEFGYDLDGNRTSYTDGNGNTTYYTYTPWGQDLSTIEPATSTYTDAADLTTTYSYDPDGKLTEAQLPGGVVQNYSYDGDGDVLTESGSGATGATATRSFTYDADGRILTADTSNTLTSSSDGVLADTGVGSNIAEDSVTSTKAGTSGSMIDAADSSSGTGTTSGTASGTSTGTVTGASTAMSGSGSVTGAASGSTGTSTGPSAPTPADPNSSTSGSTTPPTNSSPMVFDADAQNAAANDTSPSNATNESFSYDDRGDLLTATGSAGNSSFTYTPDSLMASRTDASGTTSYAYDDDDRLSVQNDAFAGTMTYAYNNDSEVTSVTYGGGDVMQYAYDPLGRETSESLENSAGVSAGAIDYGYDNDGDITAETMYGIDATSASADVQNDYTYDEAGRLTSWASTPSSTGTASTVDYGYDNDGNLTQKGSTDYSYNAQDEMTSDGSNTYSYSADGDLASVDSTSGASTAYTSDAFGTQVSIGGELYTTDALGRTVQETDAATGAATDTLTYSGASDDISSDNQDVYSRGPDGTITGYSGIRGGATAAWTDLHGDLTAFFGTSSQYLYGWQVFDPWGTVIANAGSWAPQVGFQGQWTDPTTGQVDMGSRFYNPDNGDFDNRDTVANSVNDAGSIDQGNAYAYVLDNPMTGTDPSGDCWGFCWVSHVVHKVVAKAKAVVHKVVRVVKKAAARVVAKAKAVVHSVARAVSRAVTHIRDAAVDVYHAAAHVYRAAARVVRSAYHAVARATKAAAHYVAKHAAAAVNKVKKEYEAHKSDIESALKVVSKVAGKVAIVASVVAAAAPVLDVIAAVTAEVPILDAVTAGLAATADVAGEVAELANEVSMEAGSAADAMAGDWEGALGDAVMGSAGDLMDGASDLLGDGASEASAAVDDDAGSVANDAGDSEGADATDSGDGTTSGHTTENAQQSAADAKADGGSSGGDTCEEQNSFTAGQKVMLAGGSAVAISQVKVGDVVENAVPGTSITQYHRVDAVIVTYTDHDFVNVTVTAVTHSAAKQAAATTAAGKGEHKAEAKTASGTSPPPAKDSHKDAKSTVSSGATTSTSTSTIETTFYHPFYDETTHAFVDADDLKVGDELQSTAGTTVVVSALHLYHANTTTYDLTIDSLHTFYVVAGNTPILVHNCGNEEEAKTAYIYADALQQDRFRATNESTPEKGDQGTFGTTAVIGVRFPGVEDPVIRTAINGDGPAPDSWPQWAKDAFVQGPGHAETTILNKLAAGETIEFGAASRNVCWGCYNTLSEDPGIVFGGGPFKGGPKASPYRMFWRQ